MQNIYGDLACYGAQIAELREFLIEERTQDEFDERFRSAYARPAHVWPYEVGATILAINQGDWGKWLDLTKHLIGQGHIRARENEEARVSYQWTSPVASEAVAPH